MSRTQVAIHGAAGRMGHRLIALGQQDETLQIVGAVDAPGSPAIGTSVGGLTIVDSLAEPVDVVIDFSLPAGTAKLLPAAAEIGCGVVIGTTGLGGEQLAQVEKFAGRIPILMAPNMSVGVNVLLKLVAEAARMLGPDYDIEIVEQHHRFKKDAPSGTALGLARSICDATGKDIARTLIDGRSGTQPREAGEIGMHAVRLGDTVGEHAVYFGSLGETITLSHSAHTRDTFASGALRAAAWLAGREPGLYSMDDVLFGGR